MYPDVEEYDLISPWEHQKDMLSTNPLTSPNGFGCGAASADARPPRRYTPPRASR